ncbi:MAG: glutaredoxin domain-containing protein [bacterium]|nr:glutaredoxin domain-containing protein [bacterium]
MPQIIIYTTPVCQFCNGAKEFLTDQGFKFREYDVYNDPAKVDEMIKKSGQMGVPVIDIDGEIVVGFNKSRLEEILKEKKTA